ncbi:hypothetical protein IAD21_02483 [Abditibacteriota bacterium]|nr:hypothetical protein IAD21_02483 [Abditibacteriota bacterium]
MQVSVQNTRDDVRVFSERRLQLRWGPAYWFLRRGLPALLVILSVFLLFLLWRYNSLLLLRQKWVCAIGALIGLILSRTWWFFDAFNFSFLRRAGFGAAFTLELSEAGAQLRHAGGESLIFWSTFRHVERWDARLILALDARSALIIPDRAFVSTTEAEAFSRFAEMQWMVAKNAVVPPIATP